MPTWADIGADGLWLPEPPGPLQADLRRVGDQRWGTRERAPGLRGLGWYAEEFMQARREDFVLAGREDAATNKPAVQYVLSFGGLGLFIEGDVFELRGERLLIAAGELQSWYLAARAAGKVHGRLVVIDSDFGAQRWEVLDDEPAGGVDGVSGALGWLQDVAPER